MLAAVPGKAHAVIGMRRAGKTTFLLLEEYFRRYPELRGNETVWWLLDEVQLINGRKCERTPFISGYEGAGSWRCQGRPSLDDGASAGRFSYQRCNACH